MLWVAIHTCSALAPARLRSLHARARGLRAVQSSELEEILTLKSGAIQAELRSQKDRAEKSFAVVVTVVTVVLAVIVVVVVA